MNPKRPSHRDLLALAAACYAARGLFQKDIAKQLGLSQPEISRRLKHAKTMGWLRKEPTLVREKIDPELMEQVNQLYFSHPGLARRIQALAPEGVDCKLHVVFSREEHQYGFAAADHVSSLILRARVLGIMWGRSIAAMIEGLSHVYTEPPRRQNHMEILPLCGEPIFTASGYDIEYSSSWLAGKLSKLVNGAKEGVTQLNAVAAYLPSQLNEEELEAVRKFSGLIPGYNRIYGDEGRIRDVDTILTGIGVVDEEHKGKRRTGVFLSERLARESISPEELGRLVYGEIGGVLIERPDLDPSDRALVEKLNRGWMGFQRSHLEDCARRAQQREHGCGVVVVAAGVQKAPLVEVVVKLGLVNILVIDERLAMKLEESAGAVESGENPR